MSAAASQGLAGGAAPPPYRARAPWYWRGLDAASAYLPLLLMGWRWGQLPPRNAPVTLYGPPGTGALIERMEGQIGLAPAQPGQGAVFWIALPLHPPTLGP